MTIKGYKAFNKGLICNGMKFEEGREYSIDEKDVELCKKGFHFCKNPLDVLDYYDLIESEFAEIEAKDKIETDGKKSVTSNINIKVKLSLDTFIKASIDFIFNRCKKTDDKVAASSGDYAQVASSGNYAKMASSGDYAQVASSGDYAQVASSGKDSVIAGIGVDNMIKGIKGNWITLAEWKYDDKLNRYIPLCVKTIKIDGKRIKENVYYKLVNGKFTEVK